MSAAAGGPAVRRVVISSFDNPAHPHYQGGGVAVIEAMAGRLGEDFEVTVLTVGRRSESVLHNGIRYRRLPLEWAGPRAGQLVYHAVLPFAARRIRHDLWIENFTPPFSTSFLPLFVRTPVLGFAQALQGRELSRRYRFPFFLIERLGLRCYRDVLVLNPADQALVTAANPAAAVHLIPNGIQTADLDVKSLGGGEHVLFLGRIDVWKKGIDYLIEAYERSRLDLSLLIAGAGLPREERRLAGLVERTSADVRWTGHATGERKRTARAQRVRGDAVPVRDVRPVCAGGHVPRQAGAALRPAHPGLDGWRRSGPGLRHRRAGRADAHAGRGRTAAPGAGPQGPHGGAEVRA